MYLISYDVVHWGTWIAQAQSLFTNLVSLLFTFPFMPSFQQISRKTLNTAPPIAVPPAGKDLDILKDTFMS